MEEKKVQVKSELTDRIVIENLKGSYKKFADSLDEYPILGVTFPCEYGYIEGYKGEDDADLDIFLGSGDTFGYMIVRRDDARGGLETKILYKISNEEIEQIKEEYGPVLDSVTILNSEQEILDYIQRFK
jgi:hypothetical protein